ncbi:MAG TPA: lytic transglycosylase domain-containing protein [Pyrinomonadaceae bacterium]|jgi:soluble lytic murein transglycosylase-like protein|nr:lytic transglycosylase domain-containing protein [Pyrinomonadaceae bacterium]
MCCAGAALADRVHLKDGTTIEADEAWDDPQGVWYRQGGVSYLVERARVKSIERTTGDATKNAKPVPGVKIVGASFSPDDAGLPASLSTASDEALSSGGAALQQPITIYLKDGASFEVDEAAETNEGVWYKRGSLSIFIARERIDRVEREKPAADEVGAGKVAARRERRWTTGSARLDQLIRQNGARHGVDPYLIFLVMEQESHFNSRAVSPVGARGLMQLMPGTAARFGVRNSHDPAQNIAGGTRFLKQLLGRFNNRVDLVLASYNAGEGNVVKFGYRVPPFRETRNYVRKIGTRYGSSLSLAHAPVAAAAKREAVSTEKPQPR